MPSDHSIDNVGDVSTRPNTKPEKPEKPYPDFPLYPHATGKWAKKIEGKAYYFGSWGDPEGALREYEAMLEAWSRGKEREDIEPDSVSLREVCNAFLTHKERLAKSGDITQRTFLDYHKTCGRLLEYFGKHVAVASLKPADFGAYRADFAENRSPVSVKNEIKRVRTLFNFCVEDELIEKLPRFGQQFKPPRKQIIDVYMDSKGKRTLNPNSLVDFDLKLCKSRHRSEQEKHNWKQVVL